VGSQYETKIKLATNQDVLSALDGVTIDIINALQISSIKPLSLSAHGKSSSMITPSQLGHDTLGTRAVRYASC